MGKYFGGNRNYIGKRKLKISKAYQYCWREKKIHFMLEALNVDCRMHQSREIEGNFNELVF